MQPLRYLNTILTILAILLTLNLWTAWTAAPGGDALSLANRTEAQGRGIPNAGAQRQEMIDLLKKVNRSLSDMESTLTSGEVRVRIAEPENDEGQ